jgi:hypothetical protein
MLPPTVEPDRDDALVAELHRLGVRHLARWRRADEGAPLSPVALITALAAHPQARLRSALILLLLRRPSLAHWLPEALQACGPASVQTLKLFYQAAVYLRPELEAELRAHSDDQASLPDLFSAELGLPAPGSVPADEALAALGQRHAQLTGVVCNWPGTYRQHLPLFVRQLQHQHAAPVSA